MSRPKRTLDLQKLENVRRLEGKITARCPVCKEEGSDRTGNHLVLFDDGKFTCIVDSAHNRGIFKLVGISSNFSSDLAWSYKRRKDARRQRLMAKESARRMEKAKACLSGLVEKWRWTNEDVWESSPSRPDASIDDPRFFLGALFSPDDLVWTGCVHQSGKEVYLDRWRTVEVWRDAPDREIGPYVAPATWNPGTFGRCRRNVKSVPYLVLDFDGPKGWKPNDAEELAHHREFSLAITRWLREDRHWNLAAIVWTGSKSIHAWFEHPGEDLLTPFRETLPLLGIDPSLIGHPEHPCRLPGQVHEKTKNVSRVLWLR
jgi:hypothetical protein